MQEKIHISIILPIYNGEFFIKKCLSALLAQKNINDCEIIIVDDASTDNSINHIKSYKLRNLKILSLESNSGPAAARNLGLKKSVGEYIYFCDVDDCIDEEALTVLYEIAKDNNCEYVFSDFKKQSIFFKFFCAGLFNALCKHFCTAIKNRNLLAI